MSNQGNSKIERIENYARLIQRQAGKVVRPYRFDGYMNMLNKYGTQQDTSEHYHFQAESQIADQSLTMFYEGNGLFAKIIDAPAEEAIKHGFELDDVTDQKLVEFYTSALDELDWEETFMQGIKWARLFAGSIAVMLINDGRGLEEPLDWKHIKSIDDMVVFERPLITPDWQSMYNYDPNDPFSTRGSRLGMPEYYTITSRNGTFTVHESRCLVFQNGKLPENTSNSDYQLWGTPEYLRIHRAIRDAEIAHGSAAKMLDRSIQAIYKMKNLSAELATDQGEDRVLKRLQTIDMARSFLNSITIDAEYEDYAFQTFQFTGVPDVIDATCNFLSALTSIPQTILFGRSPAGMNATGDSDLENWYNYVERMQKRMVRSNLRYLLSIIFQAGVSTGEVDEVPNIKVKFNPLWSVSEAEAADLEQKKAQVQLTRAQTAQVYIETQVIDPSEVRSKLADSDEFDVENMLDEIDEDELYETYQEMEGKNGAQEEGTPESPVNPSAETPEAEKGNGSVEPPADAEEGNSSEAAPAATKLPQDMTEEEEEEAEEAEEEKQEKHDSADKNIRMDSVWDEWLEEHLEDFASDKEQIAFRKKVQNLETVDEIDAIWNLRHDSARATGKSIDIDSVHDIISLREFLMQYDPGDDEEVAADGGPGSGNFGHKGRPGEIGGSAPAEGGAASGSSKSSETGKKSEGQSAKTSEISGKSASGSTSGAKKSYKISAPGHVTTGKTGKLQPKSKKSQFISTADAIKEDKDSGEKHSLSDHVDAEGNLSKERQAVHDRIIGEAFAEKEPYDGRPTMIMSGGGPASGKTFIRKNAEKQFGIETVSTIDPDTVKKALPGYHEMALQTETAAGFYHEESSALAKRQYQYAVDNNINVVYDGTGDGSVGSVMSKINAAREAGYAVTGSYVTVEIDEAIKRNQQRYEDGVRKFKAGETDDPPRKPRPDIVRETHKKVTDISLRVAHEFDHWELFDNNGPLGSTPVKIATCERGGKITAVKGQEDKLQKYLDKGTTGAKVINGVVVLPDE